MPSWLKKGKLQKRNVKLTNEAIYDIVDTEEYITIKFGKKRALEYHASIYKEISALSTNATIFPSTGLLYRNYIIYKLPFPPAIIFWVVKDDGVHVLRVPREESDWETFFKTHKYYEYGYKNKEE